MRTGFQDFQEEKKVYALINTHGIPRKNLQPRISKRLSSSNVYHRNRVTVKQCTDIFPRIKSIHIYPKQISSNLISEENFKGEFSRLPSDFHRRSSAAEHTKISYCGYSSSYSRFFFLFRRHGVARCQRACSTSIKSESAADEYKGEVGDKGVAVGASKE